MNSKHVDFRVRSIFEDLTRSERKIAQYVLDKPEEVIKMTASQLAEASGTSPASVIRFCKSIGIPSFPELKLELSAERDSPVTQEYSDIASDEKISDVKSKLLGNAYQAMKETVQLADEETLLKASREIANASFIYVFGIGSSYLVAENVSQKWNRIGKVCICMPDVHQLIASLTSAPADALFIGISNSGETAEVLSLNTIAQNRGLKTISITEFSMNSLSKKTDVNLNTVRSKEVALRSAATSSLMSQFMLVDLLFYTYVLEDYDKHMAYILNSRELVDDYKRLTSKR
ncbi:MurR/RpiR family transcriptional regulator [Vagococcus sp. DIV0080]|uniref:MurR/RpiR family transcriptional regulator n=1 Tax=Candidatus Vagococcus giribetii TaxID=2230876 RepID=A0ABS3HS40_9ENTE|nr:MurR/RpiR family transcriptional regulator [Vagococcus sp. DIV0080]MBO0476579.1 MurR/RpiR family transcriptional regulator [Vagococcus sp. DIV0080]